MFIKRNKRKTEWYGVPTWVGVGKKAWAGEPSRSWSNLKCHLTDVRGSCLLIYMPSSTTAMSDNNDTFVVLDPHSENDATSAWKSESTAPPRVSEPRRSNFIVITADSLGYSDLSCYGSEIRTPHIDSLASHGTRFTDFHNTGADAPSHASLFTGADHHVSVLGHGAESADGKDKLGHDKPRKESMEPMPEQLRIQADYYTAMSGKWDLGNEPEHFPDKHGFDRSFALLAPAANHFAWEPEIAPNEDGRLPRFAAANVTALHAEDGRYVDNDGLPSEFYSSDYYTDKLLDFLHDRPKHKPFFAHLSFSAPHWPLQAPVNDIRQYFGVYDEGPKTLREQRTQALKKLGLISRNTKPHDMIANEIEKWGSMTPSQRAHSARRMETYAAMVSRVDYNVGRLLSWLKYHGLYANTQIIFTSTSGPAGASPDLEPHTGPEVKRYISQYYDNSLANIGSPNSFTWYGARWAQTASPFRLYQGFPTEGGTRVPLILKPASTNPTSTTPPLCHALTSILDIAPTLLAQAGIDPTSKTTKYTHGLPLLPLPSTTTPRTLPTAHHGQASLRRGAWKISLLTRPHGSEEWELFDLSTDAGETSDLARKRPDKVEELVREFLVYKEEVGVRGLGRGVEMRDQEGNWGQGLGSRGVMQREVAKRARRREGGGEGSDDDDDDEFQDLDDDAVEM